ncbi:MAG: hypothetical protein FWD57_17120, partial [Polyangiaceae bacterium]|nr:hypothetical protein [Polyangiaceae bacterium]
MLKSRWKQLVIGAANRREEILGSRTSPTVPATPSAIPAKKPAAIPFSIPTVGVSAILATILCAGSVSCGAGSDDDGAWGGSNNSDNSGGNSGSGGDYGGPPSEGGNQLPPEKELEASFKSPVATGNYLWIANPSSGRVAYVNAVSLSVETVLAGNGPTFVAAIPNTTDDTAVVINVASNDATLMRTSSDGTISTSSAPVHSDANSWAVAPSGQWAIAWSDARSAANVKPADAFQNVSVIGISDAAVSAMNSTQLTVGYRPTAVAYNAAETEAFVVTQDGISVISLSTAPPAVVRLVPISDDPFDTSDASDVSITPDGVYAFVRRDNDPVISVLPLAGGPATQVFLPGPCTDLDLAADGSTAVAVVRETNDIA